MKKDLPFKLVIVISENFHLKIHKWGAREMAGVVKGLTCQHEDLCSDPQDLSVCTHILADKQIPLAFESASLAS